MISFESDVFSGCPEENQFQKLGWYGQVIRHYIDRKQNWIDRDDWLRLLVRTSEQGGKSNWAGLTAQLAYIFQHKPDSIITKKLGQVLINNLDQRGIVDNVSPMMMTASLMSGREDVFSDWFYEVANSGNKKIITTTGDTLEDLLRKQPVSKNEYIQEQAVKSQKVLFDWFLNWLDKAAVNEIQTEVNGDGQTLKENPYGDWLLKSWEVIHLRRDVTKEQCFRVYHNAITLLAVNPEKAMAILTDRGLQIERPGFELMWYLGGRRRVTAEESTKNLDNLFRSITRMIEITRASDIQQDESCEIWKALKKLPLLIPQLPKSLDAGIGLMKLTKSIIPKLKGGWLTKEIEPWWWYGYRYAYQNYIYQCRLGLADNMNPKNQFLRAAHEVGAGRLPAADPSYQKYLAIRDSSELFNTLDRDLAEKINDYDRNLMEYAQR